VCGGRRVRLRRHRRLQLRSLPRRAPVRPHPAHVAGRGTGVRDRYRVRVRGLPPRSEPDRRRRHGPQRPHRRQGKSGRLCRDARVLRCAVRGGGRLQRPAPDPPVHH
jgi:hypothetical protein